MLSWTSVTAETSIQISGGDFAQINSHSVIARRT